jgi:hypothetical protein
MIGLRTVGCCVHVATLINYLGKYKYTPFKLPAIYLDSVLAKMDQPSNFPSIVRNKRISRRREAASSSEDDSTDSYASSDHDDSDYFESDFTESDSDIRSRPLENHSSSDDDSENNDNYEESIGLSAQGEIPTISASQILHSLNEPVSQLSRTESAASGMLYSLNEPGSQLSHSESEASGILYSLNEPVSQLSRTESAASGMLYSLNEPGSQLSHSESDASGINLILRNSQKQHPVGLRRSSRRK